MRKSFLVIGLGRFGMNVCKTLSKLNVDVIAVDIDEEKVSDASDYVAHCVIGNASKKAMLQELGVKNIDHAIVAIGNNLQATILTTMNLKEANVPNITVRVDDIEYRPIIERLGASKVIIPEEASAIQLANEVASDAILEYHMLQNEYAMVKLKVDEDVKPRSLLSLNARNKFAINIVAIVRNDEFMIPRADDILKPNDIVIVVGNSEGIFNFKKAICS